MEQPLHFPSPHHSSFSTFFIKTLILTWVLGLVACQGDPSQRSSTTEKPEEVTEEATEEEPQEDGDDKAPDTTEENTEPSLEEELNPATKPQKAPTTEKPSSTTIVEEIGTEEVDDDFYNKLIEEALSTLPQEKPEASSEQKDSLPSSMAAGAPPTILPWSCSLVAKQLTAFIDIHISVTQGHVDPYSKKFAETVILRQIALLDPTKIIFSKEDTLELTEIMNQNWKDTTDHNSDTPSSPASMPQKHQPAQLLQQILKKRQGKKTISSNPMQRICDVGAYLWERYTENLQRIITTYGEAQQLLEKIQKEGFENQEYSSLQEYMEQNFASEDGFNARHLLAPLDSWTLEEDLKRRVLQRFYSEHFLLKVSTQDSAPFSLLKAKTTIFKKRLAKAQKGSSAYITSFHAFLSALDPLGGYLSQKQIRLLHTSHFPFLDQVSIARVRGHWITGPHGLSVLQSTDHENLLEESKLKPGDILLAADTTPGAMSYTSLVDLNSEEIQDLLLFPRPRPLNMILLRKSSKTGYELLKLQIMVEKMGAQPVSSATVVARAVATKDEEVEEAKKTLHNILILKLKDFYHHNSKEEEYPTSTFNDTLKNMQTSFLAAAEPESLKHSAVILDLRSSANSGMSYLSEAMNISSIFTQLPSFRLRQPALGKPQRGSPAVLKEPLWTGALVVLIDHFTSYTAELIAVHLKATKRALIIGAPTHGRGYIRSYHHLKDRDTGENLNISFAELYPFTGLSFQRRGVKPHIKIPTLSHQYKDVLELSSSFQAAKHPTGEPITADTPPSIEANSKRFLINDPLIDWLTERFRYRDEIHTQANSQESTTESEANLFSDDAATQHYQIRSVKTIEPLRSKQQEESQSTEPISASKDTALLHTLQITSDYINYLNHVHTFAKPPSEKEGEQESEEPTADQEISPEDNTTTPQEP